VRDGGRIAVTPEALRRRLVIFVPTTRWRGVHGQCDAIANLSTPMVDRVVVSIPSRCTRFTDQRSRPTRSMPGFLRGC
jgi:hypothetical protein